MYDVCMYAGFDTDFSLGEKGGEEGNISIRG